jgi:hypothetical protein
METPLARSQHPPPPARPLGAARQPEIDLQGGTVQGMGAAAAGGAHRVVIIERDKLVDLMASSGPKNLKIKAGLFFVLI